MTAVPFSQPPTSLCLLRLSAIGDVTHMLPIIATLREQWPETRLTWIIGRVEYQLVKSLPAIEFIVFDKRNGLAEYRALRRKLAGRKFDVLLQMQVALRANLIGLLIRSSLKIGYDEARSRNFHALSCNLRIDGPERVHVLDVFFQFLEKLGIESRRMNWLLEADAGARDFAREAIGDRPAVVINPCSSARLNNYRNWPEANYAGLIDYLEERGLRVIVTGGPATGEIEFAERVLERCRHRPLNLVGKTSLMQLLALLEQARCIVAPDTGPAHMGTVAGIPVIGLYASSNPLRTGPYNSQSFLVNAYPEALLKYNRRTLEQARWGERVRDPRAMEMISLETVIHRIESCLGQSERE